MPLAPAIAASLSAGLPLRSKALWIGGLDVLRLVDPDTIELVEAGPGQVSELTFTIDDPNATVGIAQGSTVLFMDIARNTPLFLGWVDACPYDRLGLGRIYRVSCVGAEIVLDWMKVQGPLAFTAGSDAYAAVASCIANATGIGVPLRYGWNVAGASTIDLPFLLTTPTATIGYDVSIAGVTLRQAITTIIESMTGELVTDFGLKPGDWRVTVDWYLGLRSWDSTGEWVVAGQPSEWTTLTVAGPSRYPANTQFQTAGIEVRGVLVIGGNAAGSGVVSDGTGIPGEIAIISDSAILTEAAKRAVALRYLAANAPYLAGTFDLEENTTVGASGAQVHAGGKVTITDPTLGLAAYPSRITEIRKTFTDADTETWHVTFGVAPQMASDYIRQLTRTTRG